MSLKDVVDAEKPYFDYAAYTLRLAAWFVAIYYVAKQNLRPNPLGEWSFFVIGTWLSIILFTGIGIFLICRYIRMSMNIAKELSPHLEKQTIRNKILRMVMGFWLFYGIPFFVLTLTAELVDQVIERASPTPDPTSPTPSPSFSAP